MLAVGAESPDDSNPIGKLGDTLIESLRIHHVSVNVLDNTRFQCEVFVSGLVALVPRSEPRKVSRRDAVSEVFLNDVTLLLMVSFAVSHDLGRGRKMMLVVVVISAA
jgi:hypothetical protein